MPSLPVLTYGTAPNRVELMLSGITAFDEKSVFSADGSRYLYDHYRIVCRGVVNPVATQAPADVQRQGGRAVWPRIAEAGRLPGGTIARLGMLLMEPRRKLVVRIGNDLILESPQRMTNGVQLSVDCNQGPAPISFNVVEVLGPESVVVDYAVETWVRKCHPGASNSPTVLSNQWDVDSDIDENYITTRTVTGKAVLRRDLMAIRTQGNVTGLRPQDFFPSLCMPVAEGMQRVGVHAHYASDGTSIDYTLTDVTRPWGINPGHAILRVSGYVERDDNFSAWTNPSVQTHMHLEVVGYPHCSSATLVNALAVVRSSMRTRSGQTVLRRLGMNAGDRPFQSVRVRVNFPERTASLDQTVRVSGVLGAFALIAGNSILDVDGQPENFGPRVGGPTVRTNPGMGWNNTTMDPLLALVTQALSDPRTTPPLPALGRAPISVNA